MNAAAAAFDSGLVAMSQNVPNMKRKPLPLSQFSWNTRRRSSSDTVIASTSLSWNPKATTELRTWSQIASKSCLVRSTSAWSTGPFPDGTQYCGERWKTVRWPAIFAAATMNWVPVEPVPITPTRLPVMSRSFGQALVCTSGPAKVSRPGMSGMLLFASRPSALTR